MTAAVTPLREGDPDRLGAYRLTGLLGEGGQGAVYLGEDDSGRRVAVKLLHARFSEDPKARARFAAEVATAKRVSAFCTARVLDSDVEGDRPYIVSEYIEGPSLSEVVASEGPRRGPDLDRLAIGTMTALAAIHQAGVVHRDFKPANVLLAPDGPRVIDFGIARALDATGTMSSTAIGTPAYMAPEQISGAQVDAAADVFAWGTTMVYAATGRPPFGQDSIPAVMHRVLNLPPELGELTEPLRQVVMDCLSKDPALRPASEQVLAHLLSLAGTLPQPGAKQESEDDDAILTQGAATAATTTTQLRIQGPPRSLLKLPQQPVTPPPGQAPQQNTPVPNAPVPNAAFGPPGPDTPQTAPQQSFTPPLPVPGPPPAGGQAAGTVPGPWPGGPTIPSGGKPSRKGPRIGVLASVGGAALVALILVGSVVVHQLTGREENQRTDPQGRTGGTFRMAAPEPGPGGFDPANAVGQTGAFVVRQLFTGLTDLDAKGNVRNRLATNIVPDSTCREWKIGIRQGTTFSDGSPVNAGAFMRGWTRAAKSKVGAASYLMTGIKGFKDVYEGKADELSGVTAISQYELAVTLDSSNCDFPAALAEPPFMPVPEQAGDAGDESFGSRPIGNGPFVLREYQPNRKISLARNASWAFGKTRLDGVEITLAADPALTRTVYAAELVDWSDLSGEGASSAPNNDLLIGNAPFTRMLVPITTRGPMKSRQAREAVSLALDRQKLSGMFGGVHKPAKGIVPPSVPGFGTSSACALCIEPDPDRAKELAERAGLKSGTTVRLYTRDSTLYRRLAESVRDQLQSALGWRVEMKVFPLSQFAEYKNALAAKDASGLALYAYGPDYASAYSMLWPLLAGENAEGRAEARTNVSGWKNPHFDNLLLQAARTPSAPERTQLLKRAEQLALDDSALIPLLYEGKTALAKSDRFVGLAMDYYGYPTLATTALK
ncbi:MAG TPA: ABC transporter substrate-binding protein [Spirillospora sp.]